MQVVTRMPSDLVAWIDEEASERGETRAGMVRLLVEGHLKWLAGKRDAEAYARCPQTDEEMISSAPDGWADLPWDDDAPWPDWADPEVK